MIGAARRRTVPPSTSDHQLQLILDSLEDCALVTLDGNGVIASWNHGAERLFGYAADEMLDAGFERLYVSAAGDSAAADLLRRAALDGPVNDTGWCQFKAGDRRPAEIVLMAQPDADPRQRYSVLIRDRSERTQSEAAILLLNHSLQQRVQELEAILDVLPVGVAIAGDPECREIRGNAVVRELTASSVGGNTALPVPPNGTPPFALQRAGRVLEPLELPMHYAAVHDTRVQELEVELVRADGRRRAILAYAAPLHDPAGNVRGAVGAFLDITTRKQTEAALKASEARLGGMIESAMDAILSVNEDQRIVVFNLAAEQMFGCTAAGAIGQPLDHFIPPASRAAHREFVPAFGATGATSRTMHRLEPLRALRADGSEFPIEATVSQIGAPGEKLYTAIIRDVTERVRAEQERTELLQRERAARAVAEDAVQLRDVFLSIAAHELKTPLTALLGFAHVLGRRLDGNPTLTERERRAMSGIGEQGDRIRRMIDTLLDLTRVQRGNLELEQKIVDMTALCERVALQVRASLETHTLHLQLAADSIPVLGDELRLEQVLQNLLQNAVKYSPDGGPILLRLQRQDDTVVLAVTDQGIGIPEAAQSRLFAQFFRASNVDPHRISGLGLGLYLINQIIMAHGGKVEVASREGYGSTFTVRLPASIHATAA